MNPYRWWQAKQRRNVWLAQRDADRAARYKDWVIDMELRSMLAAGADS